MKGIWNISELCCRCSSAIQDAFSLLAMRMVCLPAAKRRGFLPFAPLLILVFLLIMLVPILLGTVNETFLWIMRGFFALTIFLFVQGIMGKSILTYVISGVLIYIFVWKFWYLFAAGYMLYTVVGFGLTSVLFFGLQK